MLDELCRPSHRPAPHPPMPFAPADTRNDHPLSRGLWLLVALGAVGVFRLWRLPEAGPPDYDSVRNWQVIGELAQGNVTHLFHHGSPGFLLLYVPVAAFTQNFLV